MLCHQTHLEKNKFGTNFTSTYQMKKKSIKSRQRDETLEIRWLTWRRNEQLRGRSSHRNKRRCHGGGYVRWCATFGSVGIDYVYVISAHTPILRQFVHIATGRHFWNLRRRYVFIVSARSRRRLRITFRHCRRTKTDIRHLRRWRQCRGTAVTILIFVCPLLRFWIPYNLQCKRYKIDYTMTSFYQAFFLSMLFAFIC